jgi:hypothetical protein
MTVAAALVLETVPLAGIVMAGNRDRWSDLFLVSYVAAVGLLLSAAAMIDDRYDLTSFIGLSTDALAAF